MNTLSELIARARARGALIAVAESCTGGLLGAALTDIPGSSAVFLCGFITYSNDAKCALLGVKEKTLITFGAVSEETAREMAEGALIRSKANIALAITGIAGPGGDEHKPEGRVCFACAKTGQTTDSETVEFGPRGRKNVREAARDYALDMIARAL